MKDDDGATPGLDRWNPPGLDPSGGPGPKVGSVGGGTCPLSELDSVGTEREGVRGRARHAAQDGGGT